MKGNRSCNLLAVSLCAWMGFAQWSPMQARTITWSDMEWHVKTGYWGPGPNHWSDSTNNVWVDDAGALHLRITQEEDEWYAAEVETFTSFGYGEYRFQTTGRLDLLDSNVVGGAFVYLDDSNEIDIEFVKVWTGPTNNASYATQPSSAANMLPFRLNLTNGALTTHRFIWEEDYIFFQSYHGHGEPPTDPSSLIAEWFYVGRDIPYASIERVHLNLWLFQGQAPVDTQGLEMVVDRFAFIPSHDAGLPSTHVRDVGDDLQRAYGPLSSRWDKSRIQSLYLAEEIAWTGRLEGVALQVIGIPFLPLSNYTVRVRHYDEPDMPNYWVSNGWSTVVEQTVHIGSNGWFTLWFTNAFDYDGVRHLLVDFSHDNGARSFSGLTRWSPTEEPRTYWRVLNGGVEHPTTWTGQEPLFSGPPPPGLYNWHPNIRLLFAPPPNDGDEDGLPDAWELQFAETVDEWHGDDDTDGDGISNRSEFEAGTDPTDALSVLTLDGVEQGENGHCVLSWNSVSNRRYQIERAPSVDSPFDILASYVPPTPPLNRFGHVVEDASTGLYRLRAQDPGPDHDGDGMPDAWEVEHGLDPMDPSDGSVCVTFTTNALLSFSAGQDVDRRRLDILEDGQTLHLWGNSWKAIKAPVVIGPDTVLRYEFNHEGDTADIQGVGAHINLREAGATFFQNAGAESWGHTNYADDAGSGWKQYDIPIGQFVTGAVRYIFFVNDADSGQATSAYYRNICLGRDSDADGLFNREEYVVGSNP